MHACQRFYADFGRRALLLASDRDLAIQRQKWWTEFYEDVKNNREQAEFFEICCSCQTPYETQENEQWVCCTETEGDCLRWCSRPECPIPVQLRLCPACDCAMCPKHTSLCEKCKVEICDMCMEYRLLCSLHKKPFQ